MAILGLAGIDVRSRAQRGTRGRNGCLGVRPGQRGRRSPLDRGSLARQPARLARCALLTRRPVRRAGPGGFTRNIAGDTGARAVWGSAEGPVDYSLLGAVGAGSWLHYDADGLIRQARGDVRPSGRHYDHGVRSEEPRVARGGKRTGPTPRGVALPACWNAGRRGS